MEAPLGGDPERAARRRSIPRELPEDLQEGGADAQEAPPSPSEELEEREVYLERPPGEWQGMRVRLDQPAPCESTRGCGLGLSCKEGRCGPCTADRDCAQGEVCSMDHCLPSPQAECTSRDDCGADELCILDAYSATARGNEATHAKCLSASGGREAQPAEEIADEAVATDDRVGAAGPGHDLSRSVEEHARSEAPAR